MRYPTSAVAVFALLAGGVAPLVVAATYRLEKTHVDLLFAIDHAGFTAKHGSFRELDATLNYDEQKPESSQIDVTVSTGSVDTGFPARDADLKSDKYFDVAKYPQMRFQSTKVTVDADGTLRIEGQLTLHGVTKPLTLHAKLNKAAPNPFDHRPTLGFGATGTLKRSDFGMSTAVPIIGDVVTLTIDAEFNRPATAGPGA